MISRAQERTLRGELTHEARAKMTALERGMLKWAVIERDEKVLDANVGTGMIAEYLKRNAQCEVCGVSDNMEDVKQARTRLQSCDIIYASAGDIPWRDQSFDTALLRMGDMEPDDISRSIGELARVLKSGGQLVLGMESGLRLAMFSASADAGEARRVDRRQVEAMLGDKGFVRFSYQRVSLGYGVLIAWKRKPSVEEAIEQAKEE